VLYNGPNAPAGNPPGLFGLTAGEVMVTRYDSGDQVKDRIEVSIHDVPMRFYSPLLNKALAHRPFRCGMWRPWGLRTEGLHPGGHLERLPIAPRQIGVGFRVAREGLGLGIKGELPARTIRNVAEVAERR
jgi:hypothetical protein